VAHRDIPGWRAVFWNFCWLLFFLLSGSLSFSGWSENEGFGWVGCEKVTGLAPKRSDLLGIDSGFGLGWVGSGDFWFCISLSFFGLFFGLVCLGLFFSLLFQLSSFRFCIYPTLYRLDPASFDSLFFLFYLGWAG
jgi:hypothetical protein